jgi:factor associated with neutral sphingomyelinase activation
MFPLAKVKKIEQLALPSPTTPTPNRISKWKDQQEGFVVETRMLVKMKEDGIDAPYVLVQF